ncbi:MAG TPA: nitroreductase family protein [Actinomycetota bacterium]|nr:nitroreductase family protein [Actinomycetota bacterium]
METWDAIRARRNVRSFADRAISDDHLRRIAEAAWRTPSSMNQQAWTFVVVTDHDTLRRLGDVWRYAEHVAGSAATIAVVAPTTDDPDTRETYQYDLGQATMSVMLAAADLGVGSCHAAVADQDLARRLLGVPADHRVEWLISLGYPADRPLTPIARPERRAFDEVVRFGAW